MENNSSLLKNLSEGNNVLLDVISQVPFGFAVLNKNLVFNSVNKTFLEMVARSETDIIGKYLYEVFPELKDLITPVYEGILKTGESFKNDEFPVKFMRNGEMKKVYLSVVFSPVFQNNEITHFATTAMEVTSIISAKNKFSENEERLRLATESNHTGIWDLNLKTREIIHSNYLAEMFGYPHDAVLKHDVLRSHLHEADRVKIVDKAFHKAMKTGIYNYEARIIDAQNNLRWVSTHGKVFYDKNGNPERMLGVMSDITERKNTEILLEQNHHELTIALDATKLGRFDMDPVTLKKYNFSERLLEIFGYSPDEELTDNLFQKHIPEEYQHLRRKALETSKKTGNLHYQTKIVLRDGTEKWIEIYGKLLTEGELRGSYFTGTVRDFTENKNFQKQIQSSEKRYRFLADSMPQFIWTGDDAGKLTYFNQAIYNFTGKTEADFADGVSWMEIVHPLERKSLANRWFACQITKEPFNFEHRLQSKTGEYLWYLSRAVPDLDEKGNIRAWIGTSTDINDIKIQEKHRYDFIKMANHELKTPITTIKGYVQLLKKMRGNSDDKFLNNSLHTIENQVNKLNLLIGDLLDISRIESGSLPLNEKSFSLLEFVTETIEDIKASEQSHQIYFSLHHNSDIEVFGDKERITQVLNNLLTNAIKYSPAANKVEVEVTIEDDFAVVSVQDYGIGMEESELTKIFDRFYRVSGDDEKTFPGFGIGLFIVKDILERHGGKIWVESKKNEGSKFYFSLPIYKK